MHTIIHDEKDCAWCELPSGGLLYGKNVEDVSSALDDVFEHFETYETTSDEIFQSNLSYNK